MSICRWHALLLISSLMGNSIVLSQDEKLSLIIEKDCSSYRIPNDKINNFYRVHARKRGGNSWVGNFFGDAIRDVVLLNRNLFVWNSFKVISTSFPLFVATCMIDEKTHGYFYDSMRHKNINQMPQWCHTIAEASTTFPLIVLGLDGLLSSSEDKFYTAKILLAGTPFVIWTKSIIKEMKFEACLRPWSEHFSCENRAYGGFPSGHMAQAMYAAVLYGVRYGPRYAVPLGALATFLAATFISCNRHYVSQVVGGAAFGTLYAFSANTLVDSKLTDRVKLGLRVDERGAPKLSLAFKF